MLRFLTFNVCRDGQGMGMLGWAKRRIHVLSFLRGIRAHIIGLQEVTPRQLIDFDMTLSEIGMVRAGARIDGDPHDHRNPIYYAANRLKLHATEVREIAGHPSHVNGAVVGRSYRRSTLEDTRSGNVISCVNLHLDPGFGGWQDLGAAEVHDDSELHDAVVMGDFNSDPGSAVHRNFLGAGWQDPARCALTETYTFQNALTGNRRRIDWILLPRSWAVVSYAVLGDASTTFSDHRPVLVIGKAMTPRPLTLP